MSRIRYTTTADLKIGNSRDPLVIRYTLTDDNPVVVIWQGERQIRADLGTLKELHAVLPAIIADIGSEHEKVLGNDTPI